MENLDSMREFNQLGDDVGWPRAWVVCPHCGKQSWRVPPHGVEPCPIVAQTAEQLGMRFDAERMAAVRSGVHLEEATRALREYFGNTEEDL